MKKKSLKGKLNLKKQKISKLSAVESSQIKGGGNTLEVCGVTKTMAGVTQLCGPLCEPQ